MQRLLESGQKTYIRVTVIAAALFSTVTVPPLAIILPVAPKHSGPTLMEPVMLTLVSVLVVGLRMNWPMAGSEAEVLAVQVAIPSLTLKVAPMMFASRRVMFGSAPVKLR